MDDLRQIKIPNFFLRFLTKFNLGIYAATNMNEFMAERIMEQNLRTIRGQEFNFDEWKEQEKNNGWLFKDPNRPLENEEIEYIQRQIDNDISRGQEPIVGEYIDDVRGWKPEYNYADKLLH